MTQKDWWDTSTIVGLLLLVVALAFLVVRGIV